MSTSLEIIAKIKQRGLNKCYKEQSWPAEKDYMIHELEISLHHALVRLAQMATGPGILGAESKLTLKEIEEGVDE